MSTLTFRIIKHDPQSGHCKNQVVHRWMLFLPLVPIAVGTQGNSQMNPGSFFSSKWETGQAIKIGNKFLLQKYKPAER
ncbi:MAG: hypothetical protein WCO56_09400 [Verrucomicrobiota bacterium]